MLAWTAFSMAEKSTSFKMAVMAEKIAVRELQRNLKLKRRAAEEKTSETVIQKIFDELPVQ